MSLWAGGCLHPARPANARCEGCQAGDPYWEPPPAPASATHRGLLAPGLEGNTRRAIDIHEGEKVRPTSDDTNTGRACDQKYQEACDNLAKDAGG